MTCRTIAEASHQDDRNFLRQPVDVILDQHLDTVIKMFEANDQRQGGDDRGEGPAVVGDDLFVGAPQGGPEGKDEKRDQDQQRNRADFHRPEMCSARFSRAQAHSAFAVCQISHVSIPQMISAVMMVKTTEPISAAQPSFSAVGISSA